MKVANPRRVRHRWPSLLVALMGCNAILDNQEAWLAETGASPTLPWEGEAAAAVPDAAHHDHDRDGGIDAACRAGEHRCTDRCVSDDDPAFGCGASDCAPCVVDHAVATCSLGACAIGRCEPSRADCNQVAADGCEVDLSLFETCGSCNVSCTTERPICAPVGETFGCITGCPSELPLRCGADCVDVQTNDAHCGECGHECGPIERCIAGSCRWF